MVAYSGCQHMKVKDHECAHFLCIERSPCYQAHQSIYPSHEIH